MDFVPLSFISELIHPPMAHSSRVLKELYMEISEAYGFTTFQLLAGGKGAQLQTDEKKQLSIMPEKITYKDDMTGQTFEGFREEFGGLIHRIRERLRVPVFVSQVVVIRVLSPLHGATQSIDYVSEKFLRFGREEMSIFDRSASGVGLRLVFPPTRENASEFQIRIEPYFRDLRMLFLENNARFFQPVQTREQVEEKLQAAYDFLRDRVSTFLESAGEVE